MMITISWWPSRSALFDLLCSTRWNWTQIRFDNSLVKQITESTFNPEGLKKFSENWAEISQREIIFNNSRENYGKARWNWYCIALRLYNRLHYNPSWLLVGWASLFHNIKHESLTNNIKGRSTPLMQAWRSSILCCSDSHWRDLKLSIRHIEIHKRDLWLDKKAWYQHRNTVSSYSYFCGCKGDEPTWVIRLGKHFALGLTWILASSTFIQEDQGCN